MRQPCGCVVATSKNTSSVRDGYEMGGYIKRFCPEHAKDDAEEIEDMYMTKPVIWALDDGAPITVIYHAKCADGFGAAWAVREYLQTNNLLDKATFHAASYGQHAPDVRGEHVVMVDFSYKRPDLLMMAAQAKDVLILDHHVTAEQELVDLPENVVTVFDMDRSGAMITWETFHDDPPPRLIEHIQDRDLWRFSMPDTKAVMAAVFSYPMDFPTWDTLMVTSVDELYQTGADILRKHTKDIRELLDNTMWVRIGGYRVPAVNANYMFASDLGHALLHEYPAAPFAAVFAYGKEGVHVSLRSEDNRTDVSEVARAYGGGGHRNAAGFKCTNFIPPWCDPSNFVGED